MSLYYPIVARPRVILACQDAETAVRMIAALNPQRYRVEHLNDLNEALLRARIVLAHAVVIHGDGVDEAILREVVQLADRVTPVFVSRDGTLRATAAELDARYVDDPFDVAIFKRAVYRAVSKTQDRRQRARDRTSEMRPMQRILLLYPHQVQAAVMSAVLRDQLGAPCDVAVSARQALEVLDPTVDCVVADPQTLMATNEGAQVALTLARLGIPVIPLCHREPLDVSSAGQAAWDIAPQVRRSMVARNKIARAAG
jgi:hypothetical protein